MKAAELRKHGNALTAPPPLLATYDFPGFFSSHLVKTEFLPPPLSSAFAPVREVNRMGESKADRPGMKKGRGGGRNGIQDKDLTKVSFYAML